MLKKKIVAFFEGALYEHLLRIETRAFLKIIYYLEIIPLKREATEMGVLKNNLHTYCLRTSSVEIKKIQVKFRVKVNDWCNGSADSASPSQARFNWI